jgi:hypothetical protein
MGNIKIRHPVEFEIIPERVERGTKWVTIRIRNLSDNTLKSLDINLNSRDSFFLEPLGTGKYIFELKPNEEELLPFQVQASASTDVYVSINGIENENAFYMESPDIPIRVSDQPADLRSMFVMTEPYPPLEETLKCEANIIGKNQSGELNLEFWADTPSGRFEQIGDIKTKQLTPGEEATYAAEITPKETGLYTVHAYLYDENNRRIGHRTDSILVRG